MADEPKKQKAPDPQNVPIREQRKILRLQGDPNFEEEDVPYKVPAIQVELPLGNERNELNKDSYNYLWQRTQFNHGLRALLMEDWTPEAEEKERELAIQETKDQAMKQFERNWGDLGNAVLNGVNNGARSTWNLGSTITGGAVPSASKAGWPHNPAGDQTTLWGGFLSSAMQMVPGFGVYAGGKWGAKKLGEKLIARRKAKGWKETSVQKKDMTSGSKWWWITVEGLKADAIITFLSFDPRDDTMIGSLGLQWKNNAYLKENMPKFGEFLNDWGELGDKVKPGDMDAELAFQTKMKKRFGHVTEGVLMGIAFNFAWRGFRYNRRKKHYVAALKEAEESSKLLNAPDLDPVLKQQYLERAEKAAIKLEEWQGVWRKGRYADTDEINEFIGAETNNASGYTARSVSDSEATLAMKQATPRHIKAAKDMLVEPEFEVDESLKTLAATRKVKTADDALGEEFSEKIFLRKDLAEGPFEPELFWNYLKGIDPELQKRGYGEVSEASQQKALMLKSLKNIYPEARLREILDTPEKIRRFLLEHEKAHIDLGHRKQYDTKKLLDKRQVGMEAEATRKALDVVRKVYGKGNIGNIKNLTVSRLRALAFEFGIVPKKKGGIYKLTKAELITALKPALASQYSAKDIIPSLGGRTINRDLKKAGPTEYSGRLTEHDGLHIIVDTEAIKKDWDAGLLYMRGQAKNPFTGKRSRATQLESMVFEAMNLDIDKLKHLLGDENRYARFLEQRQRAILMKFKLKGMSPNTVLSPHDPDMLELMMEATFDTLISKHGYFGMSPAHLRKAGGPLNRTPQRITLGDIQKKIISLKVKTKRGEETGYGALQRMFNEAKNMDEFLKDVVAKDVFNFGTAGSEDASNRALAAVVKLFDDQLKLRVTKGAGKVSDEQQLIKALAILHGLDPKTSMDPKLFLIERYNNDLESLKDMIGTTADSIGGQPLEVTREGLDSLIRKGEGGFNGELSSLTGNKLKKPLHEIAETGDLNYGDLRTLSSRVLGMRLQVQQRGKQLIPAVKRLNRAMSKGEDATEEAFEVLRQIALISSDMENLATAKRSTGQTLRTFRNLDHYASLKNADGTPILDKNSAMDIMQMALANLDAGQAKGTGLRRLGQLSEAIEAATKEPSLSEADQVIQGIKVMRRSNRWGVDQINDYLISAMLSGTKTQATNFITTALRPLLGVTERYAGSFLLREKHMEGVMDLEGKPMTAVEARKHVRMQAAREMFYYSSLMLDMNRILFKTAPDTEALMFKPEGRFGTFAPTMEDAAKGVKGAFEADYYLTDILAKGGGERGLGGGELTDLPRAGAALDSQQLKADAHTIIENSSILKGSWNMDEKAHKVLNAWSESNAGKKLSGYWDGFLFATMRQPGRKLMMIDQLFKQAVYKSKIRSELAVYAQRDLKLKDKKKIATFIAELEDGMTLPNGQRYSQQNLKNWAYQKASEMELNPEETYAYADGIVRNWSNNMNVGVEGGMTPFTSSFGPFSNEARERLAESAWRKSQEYTFQTPHGQIANEALGADKDGVVSPTNKGTRNKAFEHGYRVAAMRDWIQESPLLRVFQPFLTTEANLWKQLGQRALFPNARLFRQWHHQWRADMIHSDAGTRAEVKGKIFTGMAINGGAIALVWPSMYIKPYEWITDTEVDERYKDGFRITGNGPSNWIENRRWRNEGHKPYTITWPGGFRLDLSRMEPFSYILMATANARELYEATDHDDDAREKVLDYIGSLTLAAGELFADKTHAQGVAEFVDMIHTFKPTGDEEADMRYWNKFIDRQSRKLTPAIWAQFTKSVDNFKRENNSFRDAMMSRIFPWVVPKMRDDIFNTVIPYEEMSLGHLVDAANPYKFYKPIKPDWLREELGSLNLAVGPPAVLAKPGVKALNRAQYHAKLTYHTPDKPADYNSNIESRNNWHRQANLSAKLNKLAKSRVAPGGAPCPIEEGDSYYNYWRKYMSLRKIRFTSNEAKKYHKLLEDLYPENPELKKWVDELQKKGKGNPLVGLKEIMTIAGKEMAEENKIPGAGPESAAIREATGKKSFRVEILARMVHKWREDSDEELMGRHVDLNADDLYKPFYLGRGKWTDDDGRTHKPVAPVFWPNLSRALIEYEIMDDNRRGVSLKDHALYKQKNARRLEDRRQKFRDVQEEQEFLKPE